MISLSCFVKTVYSLNLQKPTPSLYLFVCLFGGPPSYAQGLLLSLCSGITTGSKHHRGCGDWTWVSFVQGRHPPTLISLTLLLTCTLIMALYSRAPGFVVPSIAAADDFTLDQNWEKRQQLLKDSVSLEWALKIVEKGKWGQFQEPHTHQVYLFRTWNTLVVILNKQFKILLICNGLIMLYLNEFIQWLP